MSHAFFMNSHLKSTSQSNPIHQSKKGIRATGATPSSSKKRSSAAFRASSFSAPWIRSSTTTRAQNSSRFTTCTGF